MKLIKTHWRCPRRKNHSYVAAEVCGRMQAEDGKKCYTVCGGNPCKHADSGTATFAWRMYREKVAEASQ